MYSIPLFHCRLRLNSSLPNRRSLSKRTSGRRCSVWLPALTSPPLGQTRTRSHLKNAINTESKHNTQNQTNTITPNLRNQIETTLIKLYLHKRKQNHTHLNFKRKPPGPYRLTHKQNHSNSFLIFCLYNPNTIKTRPKQIKAYLWYIVWTESNYD